MRITGIHTGEIQIPLARPFKTALRTVERVEDIVVRITAENGMVGYGEAPPTAVITGDTKGSVLCAIREHIAPALTGMDILALEEVMERLHHAIKGNTSAKAAVDMALYDLWAKSQGKPLYQLLGGAKPAFETDITISVNPTQEMVRDSLEAVARGFHILKVKVGKDGTLSHFVPTRRIRLYNYLKHVGTGEPVVEAVTSRVIGSIEIDASACTACRMCAIFCPTEAIAKVDDDGMFGIRHRPSACVQCRACESICPKGAITVRSDVPTRQFIGQEAVVYAMPKPTWTPNKPDSMYNKIHTLLGEDLEMCMF